MFEHTGVTKRSEESAEIMGRPVLRWWFMRWLTESNIRSLVRTWEKNQTKNVIFTNFKYVTWRKS